MHVNEVNKPLFECVSTKSGDDLTATQSRRLTNMSLSIENSDDTSRLLIAHLKRVTVNDNLLRYFIVLLFHNGPLTSFNFSYRNAFYRLVVLIVLS